MKIKNIGAGVLAAGMLAFSAVPVFATEDGKDKTSMLDQVAMTITASVLSEQTDGKLPESVELTDVVDVVATTASTAAITITDGEIANLPEGVIYMEKVEMGGGTAVALKTTEAK